MENDIQNALQLVSCSIMAVEELQYVFDTNEISEQFMQLCAWICSQLKDYCSIQETVTVQRDTFTFDMLGFLREMDCPLVELVGIDALDTYSNRMLLLDYLLSELMACRIAGGFQDTENFESLGNPILKPIFSIMTTLNMQLPSQEKSIFEVFTDIEERIKKHIRKLPSTNVLGETLLSHNLDECQWAQVEKINDILSEEYHARRQVLLKRLDVTFQSFMWSDKAKKNKTDIIESFNPIRRQATAWSRISIADVLAAKKDLCRFDKTSAGEAREVAKCDINKVVIGKVPDRGGRPSAEAPPLEMPAFRKRTEPPKDQRGNFRGGRRNFNRGGSADRGGRGDDGGGGGGWSRDRGRGGWRGRGNGGGSAREYDRGQSESDFRNNKMYFS